MGDDVDDHSYAFSVSNQATLKEVFDQLADKKYLAQVSGINHSWEAIISNEVGAFFKGNNRQPEASVSLSKSVSTFAMNRRLQVSIKYYSATN